MVISSKVFLLVGSAGFLLAICATAEGQSDGQNKTPRTSNPASSKSAAVPSGPIRKFENPEQKATKADIPSDLPEDVKGLIEATFSNFASERAEAAKHLGQLGDRALPAIPFLIALVGDEAHVGMREVEEHYFWNNETFPWKIEISVDSEARDALCKIGRPAVEPCLAALKRQAGTVRGDGFIKILGRIQDTRAIDPLAALLRNPDQHIREEVAAALDGWNNPQLVPPMIEALKDDDETVRLSVIRSLYCHRDPRLVAPLIDALLTDKETDVRWDSARALGEQKDSRVVPALLGVIRDVSKPEGDRANCALVLGKIADPHTDDELLAVLKEHSEPDDLRCCVAIGLGRSKENRFAAPLKAMVKDKGGSPDRSRLYC